MLGRDKVALAPGFTFFCKISPLLTLLIERLEEEFTVDNLRVAFDSWERLDTEARIGEQTEAPLLELTEARDFIFLSPIRLKVESLDLVPLDLTPCRGGVVSDVFFVLVLALMEDRLDILVLLLLVVGALLILDADFDCGFKSGIVLLPSPDNCEAAFPLAESGLRKLERTARGLLPEDNEVATITWRGRFVPVLLVFLSAVDCLVDESDCCLLKGGRGGKDDVNAFPTI